MRRFRPSSRNIRASPSSLPAATARAAAGAPPARRYRDRICRSRRDRSPIGEGPPMKLTQAYTQCQNLTLEGETAFEELYTRLSRWTGEASANLESGDRAGFE